MIGSSASGARRSHESAEAYDLRPPDLITYAELEDEGLISGPISPEHRQKALEWLKVRIRSSPRLQAAMKVRRDAALEARLLVELVARVKTSTP